MVEVPSSLDKSEVTNFLSKASADGNLVVDGFIIDAFEQGMEDYHGIAFLPIDAVEYDNIETDYFYKSSYYSVKYLNDKDIIVLFDKNDFDIETIVQLDIPSPLRAHKSIMSQIFGKDFSIHSLYEYRRAIIITPHHSWFLRPLNTQEMLRLWVCVDGTVVSKEQAIKNKGTINTYPGPNLRLFRANYDKWYKSKKQANKP